MKARKEAVERLVAMHKGLAPIWDEHISQTKGGPGEGEVAQAEGPEATKAWGEARGPQGHARHPAGRSGQAAMQKVWEGNGGQGGGVGMEALRGRRGMEPGSARADGREAGDLPAVRGLRRPGAGGAIQGEQVPSAHLGTRGRGTRAGVRLG